MAPCVHRNAAIEEVAVAVESNKALIRGFFGEVLNGGRVDVLDEVISTEYVEHAALSGQEGSRPEGVQQRLAIFRAAFPNSYIGTYRI